MVAEHIATGGQYLRQSRLPQEIQLCGRGASGQAGVARAGVAGSGPGVERAVSRSVVLSDTRLLQR
jgi:hypothetical protein